MTTQSSIFHYILLFRETVSKMYVGGGGGGEMVVKRGKKNGGNLCEVLRAR